MGFINALFAVMAFVAEGISIYSFIVSRVHTTKRIYSISGICGMVVASILIMALLLANFTSILGSNSIDSNASQTNNPQTRSTSQVNTNVAQTVPTLGTTPIPTTHSPAPGTIVCQFDATHGWNGWSGAPDWKVYHGELLNDGTDNGQNAPSILAPCQLGGIADYAVEVRIRVVSGRSSYAIHIRGASSPDGWRGYRAIICCGSAYLTTANVSDMITQSSFNDGTTFHTYRLEAKGTDIKLLIDGVTVLDGTDNRYLYGEQAGMESHNTQLEVTSYKIIVL